jgi:hypothetical protein
MLAARGLRDQPGAARGSRRPVSGRSDARHLGHDDREQSDESDSERGVDDECECGCHGSIVRAVAEQSLMCT